MADDRLRRFRHLERPRTGEQPAQRGPDPGADARFAEVEGPGQAHATPPAGTPPVPEASLERFRPAAQPGVQLEAREEGSQPFVRCQACETDNSRFAARCTTCGADLDTEPQRRFNAALWADRRAQAAAEAAARAEREAALDEARAAGAQASREANEALAREVGQAERERLNADGDWWGGWRGLQGGGTPLGLELLRRIEDPWVRFVAGGAAVAVGLALLASGRLLGLVAAAVLAVSFLGVPRGLRRPW